MRVVLFSLAPGLALLLSLGCDTVGPPAIRQSRPNYNDAIHDTSRDQTFYNIIRVYNHDQTQFMDVSEVDVALQFQNNLTAAAMLPQMKSGGGGSVAANNNAGPNAKQVIRTTNTPFYAGHDFSITGSTQFQESPTIRYIPLAGQALIAQLSTPISVDSLAYLFDSDWPISAILTLTADRLTPNYEDYYVALNAIIDLDNYGALVLAAEKSDLTPAAAVSSTSAIAPNDTLVLYFNPRKLQVNDETVKRKRKEHLDRQRAIDPSLTTLSPAGELAVLAEAQADAQKRAHYLWDRLWNIYNPSHAVPPGMDAPHDRIELRTAPLTAAAWNSARAASSPSPAPTTTITTTSRVFSSFSTPTTDPTTATTAPAAPTTGSLTHFDDRTSTSSSTIPVQPTDPTTLASDRLPVLRTRSAMGLLRAATHEDWGIAVFVTPAQYDFFVHRVLADSVKNNYYLDFYRFRLDDPIPLSCKHDPLLEKANQFLARVPKVKRSPTLSQQTPFLPYDYCDVPSLYDWPYGETRMPDDDQDLKGRVYLPDPTTNPTQVTQNEIGESRHFLVIVEQDRGDSLPADTFVSYAYGDKMYYIKNEDYVSKKNFSLIGLLLTMEAVPQGSGLTPTIAVGGIGH